jgi:hypothetical protein
MEMERGSPPLSALAISKLSTEREVREERRSVESEGWMYWSISGGACSRTKGQKFSIFERSAARFT